MGSPESLLRKKPLTVPYVQTAAKARQHQPYVAFQFLHGCEFTVFNGSNATFLNSIFELFELIFRTIGSPRGGMKTVSDVPFARAQGASRASVKHAAQPHPFHLLIQQLIVRLAKQQVFGSKSRKTSNSNPECDCK